jgi:chromosome segregation protein
MYLKSLEMIGFKSFPERTKLDFEPGLIAIVGPNGCGKSNIADAIRWVLGEQRPTALRGARMMDVIFSGTDTRKPLGMAEVSITFADCEGTLPTEFHEVTVTRRVFRTGEGEYFINKAPCRLRDIQRLFMGTGIGTASYSIMAQGQIDAILSSRPEDRRTVFEEAAGITQFKADRKEALRKLERTDANLLRLADVIREIKRQIGSLQRQAARARRYQELREKMRGLDLFATRRRLAALDVRLRELEAESGELAGQEAAGQERVAAAEQTAAAVRAEILESERRIGAATEAVAQEEGALQHAREMIRLSEQRIAECRAWAERDSREAAEARELLGQTRTRLAELLSGREELAARHGREAAALESLRQRAAEARQAVEECHAALQARRDEALERERRAARLQNQIAALENRQRAAALQRERLAAEHEQLGRTLESLAGNEEALAATLAGRRARAEADAARLDSLDGERREVAASLHALREESARLDSRLAARRAQLDLLAEQEAGAESFPSGSRLLLDGSNPLRLEEGIVRGPLAAAFGGTAAEYRPALEAVLRAWIDAVVLRHADDAAEVMRRLLRHGGGAASRLVAAAGVPDPPAVEAPAGLAPLRAHVRAAPGFESVADRLLANVFVAATLDDVPRPLPAGCTVVTAGGAVFHAGGCSELWLAEGQSASPLGRRMAIGDGEEEIAGLGRALAELKERLAEGERRQAELAAAVEAARRALEESRRLAAQTEGELQALRRDVERARERHGIVAGELEAAVAQTRESEEEKARLAAALEELTAGREAFVESLAALQKTLAEREGVHGARQQELTEARIREASLAQQLGHLAGQIEDHQARVAELERQLQGRGEGVRSHEESIRKLAGQIEATQAQLEPMRRRAEEARRRLGQWREAREERSRELERAEAALAAERQALEEIRARRGRLDVERAEARVRRQNHLDRVRSEYGLAPEELAATADPDWGAAGAPSPEEAEAAVAALGAELQQMGAVNLVAIEEHKELEERFAFLRAQEEDMLRSREQLTELLRRINKESAELFQATFEQANANFEKMFARLFNGGTARLVLLENAEDPLECGVEVIARPPGKRLQSISLLSGGERTMTAVSLLFAIYMIKPSPFCILDEIDASLDDSNIGRFVQVLKDFLAQSQFLIVTHNQHTIASSDIVYGITMPEKGVSKLVSLRLHDIGRRELEVAAGPPPPEPPTIPPKRRRVRRDEGGAAAVPAPAAPSAAAPAAAPPLQGAAV